MDQKKSTDKKEKVPNKVKKEKITFPSWVGIGLVAIMALLLVGVVMLQMRMLQEIELVGEKLGDDRVADEAVLPNEDLEKFTALVEVSDGLETYAQDMAGDDGVGEYPRRLTDLDPDYVNFEELGLKVDQIEYTISGDRKSFTIGVSLSDAGLEAMRADNGESSELFEIKGDLGE